MSRPTPTRALERIRQTWTLPIARAAAARLRKPCRAALDRARAAGGRWAAKAAAHPVAAKAIARGEQARRRLGDARERIGVRRRRLIERSNAFAESSRAFCRAGAAEILETVRSPRRAAAALTSGARLLMAIARRLFAGATALRLRLRRLRMTDAAIAGLVAVALLGPAAAPHLDDDATIALTRDNPFIERNGARAERGLSVAPPATPTLWSGLPEAEARRAMPPLWVAEMLDDRGPLDPAAALAAPARVLELEPAPLWSPELDRLASLNVSDEYLPLETGSIPAQRGPSGALAPREIVNIELGAIDTGPTAPPRAAAAPADAGDVGRGDYATASVEARRVPESAWPRAEAGAAELPASIAEALNLARPRSVPPRPAPLPSMRPFAAGDGARPTARVTVVLTAIGLNEAASRAALDRLPSGVVFAVAPVAAAPARWIEAAQSDGRVALIEIPMEPKNYPRVNPGPLTLLSDAEAAENVARLEQTLALAPEADGVATYLGGKFAASGKAAAPVIQALKERDLFMLETAPNALSALRRTAAEVGLPAASSVVSLDRFGQDGDLSEGFARLELAAREKGHAIGVAVAVPSSVDALAEWSRSLEARGFRLTALAL